MKIFKFLADFVYYWIAVFYAPEFPDTGKNPDIVVPLGYGYDDYSLPDAAVQTTKQAAAVALKHQAKIVFCNVDYFGVILEITENSSKRIILERLKVNPLNILEARACQNSVTEARYICQCLKDNHIEPKVIRVICEDMHIRSVKLIWEQVVNQEFPLAQVELKSVSATWSKAHSVFWRRSRWRWLLANWARHLALLVMGVDWVAKKQYSSQPTA